MKVEQPGCISEGTARGSDDTTNEIANLGEEFAAVTTRSKATIVIIHARRDVESISTHRTRTSHSSCVIVLKVSGFSGPRSARSLSQGILEPYSVAHNLSKNGLLLPSWSIGERSFTVLKCLQDFGC